MFRLSFLSLLNLLTNSIHISLLFSSNCHAWYTYRRCNDGIADRGLYQPTKFPILIKSEKEIITQFKQILAKNRLAFENEIDFNTTRDNFLSIYTNSEKESIPYFIAPKQSQLRKFYWEKYREWKLGRYDPNHAEFKVVDKIFYENATMNKMFREDPDFSVPVDTEFMIKGPLEIGNCPFGYTISDYDFYCQKLETPCSFYHIKRKCVDNAMACENTYNPKTNQSFTCVEREFPNVNSCRFLGFYDLHLNWGPNSWYINHTMEEDPELIPAIYEQREMVGKCIDLCHEYERYEEGGEIIEGGEVFEKLEVIRKGLQINERTCTCGGFTAKYLSLCLFWLSSIIILLF